MRKSRENEENQGEKRPVPVRARSGARLLAEPRRLAGKPAGARLSPLGNADDQSRERMPMIGKL